MTGKSFFDTNVLVYAFARRESSPSDPRTHRAEEVLSAGGIVGVQTLNEFVDVASHKLKMDWISIDRCLGAIGALCGRAIPLTTETHTTALEISKGHGFRIYDSLILAAAKQAGCTMVYTEDLQHGQVIEGLRIENPFLGTAMP